MYKNNNKIWKIFLSIMLLVMSNLTFADNSTNLFDVPNTDVSLIILSQLFGSLTQISGTDAFAGAIATFNGAILFIGGILASYTILAGTLGTAHDGQMLGKKFSSVWIPIRYSIGTSLVLPILPKGYCIMQQLIMWSIMQGIGLANAVWTSYLETVNTNVANSFVLPKSVKQSITNLAADVARDQICTQTYVIAKEGSSNFLMNIKNFVSNTEYGVRKGKVLGIERWEFGDKNAKEGGAGCGFVNVPKSNEDATTYSNGTGSNVGKLGDITTAFVVPTTKVIYDAHEKALATMISNLETKAKSALKSSTPLLYSDVEKEADTYANTVTSSVTSGTTNVFSGIADASKKQGWIMAGAWYTKLTLMNKKINDAVSSVPSSSSINFPIELDLTVSSSITDTYRTVMSDIRKNSSVFDSITQKMESIVDDKDKPKKNVPVGENSYVKSYISTFIVSMLTTIDMSDVQNSNESAIVQMQKMGIRLIASWELGVVLITATSVGASAIPIIGAAGTSLIIAIVGFFFAPITALLGLGVTLAFGIPNLPFLMWIGVILGWVIMVIEAVLAGPLWAIMHLHPNGDDITGRGGNGYSLLLGVLFRPSLTIFGLIGALTVTELMTEFLNKVFFSVLTIPENSYGPLSFISVIFAFATYTSAMVQLFRKTFSLMHVIPDQLMRWAGGGGGELGQYAGGLGSATDAGAKAAQQGAQFSGQIAQVAPKAMQEYKNAKRQDDENKMKTEQLQKDDAKASQDLKNSQESAEMSRISQNDGGSDLQDTGDKLSKHLAAGQKPGGRNDSVRNMQNQTALSNMKKELAQNQNTLAQDDKKNNRHMIATDINGQAILGSDGNFTTNSDMPKAEAFNQLMSQAVSGLDSPDGGKSLFVPLASDKPGELSELSLQKEITQNGGDRELGIRSFQQKLTSSLLGADSSQMKSVIAKNNLKEPQIDTNMLINPNNPMNNETTQGANIPSQSDSAASVPSFTENSNSSSNNSTSSSNDNSVKDSSTNSVSSPIGDSVDNSVSGSTGGPVGSSMKDSSITSIASSIKDSSTNPVNGSTGGPVGGSIKDSSSGSVGGSAKNPIDNPIISPSTIINKKDKKDD